MGLIFNRRIGLGLARRLAHPICSYRLEALASKVKKMRTGREKPLSINSEKTAYALQVLSSPEIAELTKSPDVRQRVITTRAAAILRDVFPYEIYGPSPQLKNAINGIMSSLHPSIAKANAELLYGRGLYAKDRYELTRNFYYLSLLSLCEAASIKHIVLSALKVNNISDMEHALEAIAEDSIETVPITSCGETAQYIGATWDNPYGTGTLKTASFTRYVKKINLKRVQWMVDLLKTANPLLIDEIDESINNRLEKIK